MEKQFEKQLSRLAALHRVQTSYIDMHGRRCWASPGTLFAVLQALGAPLHGFSDLDDAHKSRRDQIVGEWVAPVIVAWDGAVDSVVVRVPVDATPSHALGPRMQYTLHLENGDIWSGHVTIDQAPTIRFVTCAGAICAVKGLLPPKTLPLGYHKLTTLIGRKAFQSTVIAAPRSAYAGDDAVEKRWGQFAPIYALRSERNWGVGDFTDAGVLAAWTGEQGGSFLGTLPFLASYLDKPCDPSPYTPISRFFWNELFIDVTRLPELNECAPAQELIGSATFQSELNELRMGRLVDYKRAMRLKRTALKILSVHVQQSRGSRFDAVQAHAESRPQLREYAKFRAVTEREGDVWTRWTSGSQVGELSDREYDMADEFYHQFVQCVATEQIESLSKQCEAHQVSLYLDYPLGTHPEGFDTWRNRNLFATGATVGAPPDPVFTTGQNWGFHPTTPDVQRHSGYSYFAESLRHQMKYAGMMRLDHVMGLHRLYWIPKEFPKSEGVYVRYPCDELYAVLTLESHRAQCVLIGENLGIVPGYVESGMKRHGLAGMSIAYWDIAADPDGALQRMTQHSNVVASLNTHDMFPFAAFWNALDVDRRLELEMITLEQAGRERWLRGELRGRFASYLRDHGQAVVTDQELDSVLRGILSLLAQSPAHWVMINLEDLWFETSPQNIPDTVTEHPNWRQKAAVALEELLRDERIRDLLGTVNQSRASVRG